MNSLRNLIIFALILSSFVSLKGEGTGEIMPTTSNGTALWVYPFAGTGSYLNCPSQNRISFRIKDHNTENLYFGFNIKKRNGTSSPTTPTNGYYRIKNSSGTTIVGPTAIPTTGSGYIATYARAVAGPNIGGLNSSGYSPRTFDPTSNDTYYIEIYQSDDGGTTAVTTSLGELYFPYFDFTVATTTNTKFPGRVFSQQWSLITYNPSNLIVGIDYSMEGAYYGYTNDSSVVRVDFEDGFRPYGFNLAMNFEGVTNTGNFETDRQSAHQGANFPTIANGYKVFFNIPDTSIFKISEPASAPILTNNIYGCDGTYFIPYYIDKSGDVSILLDLDGSPGFQSGGKDIVLEDFAVTSGNNIMEWNGLDGTGAVVTGGVNISIIAQISRGRTNIPMYDAELNMNGLSVQTIFPVEEDMALYWDDSNLSVVGDCSDENAHNANGGGYANINPFISMTGPAHAWDGPNPDLSVPATVTPGYGSTTTTNCDDFGNARTINTWFYGSMTMTTSISKNLPDCDLDNDGIDDTDDIDDDDDGIPDLVECSTDPLLDADADGIPNYLDTDFAGFVDVNFDGVNDNFDADRDGVINNFDLDSDNDGFSDIYEAGGTDSDNSGKVDSYVDANGNGLSDQYDPACNGSLVTGAGGTSAGTTGTITSLANILDNNSSTVGVLGTIGATVDINLGLTIPANTTVTVRAQRAGSSNQNFSVSRSTDDVTYTQSTQFTSTSTTQDFSLVTTGAAQYIRLTSNSNNNNRDINIYHVSYSYQVCNGTLGTAITNPDTDGDGVKDIYDLDNDNDGIPDLVEAGGVDTDGDGRIDSQSDTDQDGYMDVYDFQNGGDLIGDWDTDGDGVKNRYDLDSDNDGIPDVVEAFGTDANNDGLIDSYSDSDNDGYSNNVDGDANNDRTSENTANSLIITGSDSNSDGVPNSYSRANSDGNGLPNPYDLDADGDGLLDSFEAGMPDADANGIADGTLGSDGWSNTVDGYASLNFTNTDGHAKANVFDIDSDNDGIPDIIEAQTTDLYGGPSGSDSDGDGIDNAFDNNDASFGGSSNNGLIPVDTDSDGTPDYLDLDSDDDNYDDRIEGWDLDGDGEIGAGEVSYIGSTDSDGDGLLNEYDSDISNPNPSDNKSSTSFPDANNPGNDRDWREEHVDNQVLPVELFAASVEMNQEGVAIVKWTTATETNNSYFLIEKSLDGKVFSEVEKVAGSVFSNSLKNYQSFDYKPYNGISYYRITQFDTDGNAKSYPLLILENNLEVFQVDIYPNPTRDKFFIDLNMHSTLLMFDVKGEMVVNLELVEGVNSIETTNLNPGVYMVRIYNNSETRIFKLVIK